MGSEDGCGVGGGEGEGVKGGLKNKTGGKQVETNQPNVGFFFPPGTDRRRKERVVQERERGNLLRWLLLLRY